MKVTVRIRLSSQNWAPQQFKVYRAKRFLPTQSASSPAPNISSATEAHKEAKIRVTRSATKQLCGNSTCRHTAQQFRPGLARSWFPTAVGTEKRCTPNKYLLTDVLKDELGFKGFLVSDWAAIDQISRNYKSDVEQSINAGLDMVMIPYGPGHKNNYVEFIQDLKELVAEEKDSSIPH